MEGFGVNFEKHDATRMIETVRELYDRVTLVPGQGVLLAGAAGAGDGSFVSAASRIIPTVALLAGSTSTYGWVVRVKDDWTRHHVRATVRYTATVGSANTFDVTLRVIGEDKVLVVDSWSAWSVAATLTGPSAAYTPMSAEATLSADEVQIADHAELRFVIQRLAGDANANTLHILAIELFFYKAPL